MPSARKKRPFLKTVIFGLVSLASYIALFAHQDVVTDYCTRGGSHAALPIVIALYFSLVHGTFAGSLLSILGLGARKHTPERK